MDIMPGEYSRLYGKDYSLRMEKPVYRKRLKHILKHIHFTPHDTVLDAGCGSGLLLHFIKDRVSEYHGVDSSKCLFECANIRKDSIGFAHAYFHNEDIRTFCFRNPEKFDIACAFDVAEHMKNEDWAETLNALRISLKPGGKLFIHTPNGEYFLEILKKNNFILRQFPEHIGVRNPKEHLCLLEKSGFSRNIHIYLAHYSVLLRWTHIFSFAPLFGKYMRARLLIISEK